MIIIFCWVTGTLTSKTLSRLRNAYFFFHFISTTSQRRKSFYVTRNYFVISVSLSAEAVVFCRVKMSYFAAGAEIWNKNIYRIYDATDENDKKKNYNYICVIQLFHHNLQQYTLSDTYFLKHVKILGYPQYWGKLFGNIGLLTYTNLKSENRLSFINWA